MTNGIGKKIKKKRRWRWLILFFKTVVVLVMMVVTFVGAWILANKVIDSDYFLAKKFYVEGNSNLTANEVITLLGAKDKNIFWMNKKDLIENLMASPWVKKAYIRKELPDTFYVVVSETVPVALNQPDKKIYLIDEKGIRLREVRNLLPGLTVIKIAPDKKRAYEEGIKLALAISDNSKIDPSKVEINGTKPEDISMNIAGTMVLIGYSDYEKKLINYLNIEDEISKRSISVEYIDVRFANRLIVKQVKGES